MIFEKGAGLSNGTLKMQQGFFVVKAAMLFIRIRMIVIQPIMKKQFSSLTTSVVYQLSAFILSGWIGIASAQAAPALTDSGAVVQSLRIRGIRHFSQAELA